MTHQFKINNPIKMKEELEEQPNHASQQEKPSYFSLMEIAGPSGRYQTLSLIIWSIMWLVTGSLLLGTPFFFYNPPYNCSSKPALASDDAACLEYVCSLPTQQRQPFRSSDLKTIATEFGDFQCNGDAGTLDLLSSLIYFGSFFGYIVVPVLADNLGRKRSILISYTIALVGMLLVGCSANLVMVGIGLFLSGFGSDTAINICFNFITEAVEDHKRQKHSVIIQMFFSLGGVVNIPYFFAIKQWRVIFWIFFVAPASLCLFLIWKFIEDTPFFLIKLQPAEKIEKSIRKIMAFNRRTEEQFVQARALKKQSEKDDISIEVDEEGDDPNKNAKDPSTESNKGNNNVLVEQIQSLKSIYEAHQSSLAQNKGRVMTPLDLFRYRSVRTISIVICIVSFCIYLLYYGPLMLISKFSFSIYINALAVTMSEMITYPLLFCLVDRVKRKVFNICLFGASTAISGALIYIVGSQCEHDEDSEPRCELLKVFQLILVFIFRFCVSLQFAIFLIFCNEVFPTQLRGLGLGVSSCLGTVASTCSPYIFGSHVNGPASTSRVMLVFMVISGVCLALSVKFLPETLGKPIKDQIQEKFHPKQQQKQKGHMELVETS